MILVCDNCHYIFDSDSLEKFPVGQGKNFPECCPFCGATSVTYTISDGTIYAKETFPALRKITPRERNTYEKAALKAHGSIQHDNIAKKSRARIEEALAIVNSSADKLSDNEADMWNTTVEGDGRHLTPWQFCFSRELGAGIKDNSTHLYVGHPKTGFKEIYQEEKDRWPFYTFQFGVFKFPYGDNRSDTLYFHPVATKTNDLSLMAYRE